LRAGKGSGGYVSQAESIPTPHITIVPDYDLPDPQPFQYPPHYIRNTGSYYFVSIKLVGLPD